MAHREGLRRMQAIAGTLFQLCLASVVFSLVEMVVVYLIIRAHGEAPLLKVFTLPNTWNAHLMPFLPSAVDLLSAALFLAIAGAATRAASWALEGFLFGPKP